MKAMLAIGLFACALIAQGPEPEAGLVALHQARLDLDCDLVALNVAAHPDDESSRTNTMLRRKYGVRVVTVYTTYGDGGQNAIGREIGADLAALRVRETLRAAAMMDFGVRWLGMPDFGFSKTREETTAFWGEDMLLARMRAVVDEVRPDFVITNHAIDQGHGHHRASYWAIERVLAERAAAGAAPIPLYRRCSVEDAEWTMDPAELDPARGETYAALAHRAWTQHVTQGPWGAHDPLRVGKDWWKGANPNAPKWDAFLPEPRRLPAWNVPDGEAELIAMRRVVAERELAELPAEAPAAQRAALRWRIEAADRALLAMANVRIEAWLERDEVPQGGRGKANVVVHGVERVTDVSVRCGDEAGEAVDIAARNTPFDGMLTPPAGVAPEAALSSIVKAPVRPGRYSVGFACEVDAAADLPGDPEVRFATVEVSLTLERFPITVQRRLAYTPVAPLTVAWNRDVVMLPKGAAVERTLTAKVRSQLDEPIADAVRLAMGPGIVASSQPGRLSLSAEHPEARLLVRVRLDPDERTPDAGLEVGFGAASSRLRFVEVDVAVPPGLRVAVVRGPDDTTEAALADLGVAFVSLDEDSLLTARFEDFGAVLLDIRAYHHRPELAEVRDRLLAYCRGGGRVVAMYHKPNEWNERNGHPLLAPFPLTVGNDRVTEEDAVPTFLQPEHRLLRHPNAIGLDDFAGWVQERGLNFPTRWDEAWTPLLAMKDRNDEKPSEGALLYTQYGKGDFVYCSLALYRQLRVGNAGAARLLVNLLTR